METPSEFIECERKRDNPMGVFIREWLESVEERKAEEARAGNPYLLMNDIEAEKEDENGD